MTSGNAGQVKDNFGLVGTNLIVCHNGQIYTVASSNSYSVYPVYLAPPTGLAGISPVIVTATTADIGSLLTFRAAVTGDTFTYICGSEKYFQVGNAAGNSVSPPCNSVVVTTEYVLETSSSK